MDRIICVTESEIALAALETVARVVGSVSGTAQNAGRLDESALSAIRDQVRKAAELYRDNPDEFTRRLKGGVSSGYEKALKTVKDVLARHGITATRQSALTGNPTVMKTDEYNLKLTLADIKKTILSRLPQLSDDFAETQTERKMLRPSERNGVPGYECSVVGDAGGLIREISDSGLSVIQTDSRKYGFEDDQFVENKYFISKPDSSSM